MLTIQIEHGIKDFETWKAAFDNDPIDREGSGVRAHRVYRPVDDDRRIIVELDAEDAAAADLITGRLRELWDSGRAAPVLDDAGPAVRILESVEQVRN